MITIIGGRIVFKEKRTLYKMVCAAVIIAGIVFCRYVKIKFIIAKNG